MFNFSLVYHVLHDVKCKNTFCNNITEKQHQKYTQGGSVYLKNEAYVPPIPKSLFFGHSQPHSFHIIFVSLFLYVSLFLSHTHRDTDVHTLYHPVWLSKCRLCSLAQSTHDYSYYYYYLIKSIEGLLVKK